MVRYEVFHSVVKFAPSSTLHSAIASNPFDYHFVLLRHAFNTEVGILGYSAAQHIHPDMCWRDDGTYLELHAYDKNCALKWAFGKKKDGR